MASIPPQDICGESRCFTKKMMERPGVCGDRLRFKRQDLRDAAQAESSQSRLNIRVGRR